MTTDPTERSNGTLSTEYLNAMTSFTHLTITPPLWNFGVNMPFPVQSSPDGKLSRFPAKGEAPPEGSIDWIWYVPDGKAPDTPQPNGAAYHMYFKCKPCDVTFRDWKIIGQLMDCLWCGQPISEDAS